MRSRHRKAPLVCCDVRIKSFVEAPRLARELNLTNMTRCARRHERNLDQLIGERDRKKFIRILKKIAAEIE